MSAHSPSPRPRVSILIPNFNNGRGSSRDGRTDLIGDLLQSLHDTLHDDPTPVEILAYDDGSTDDGLDTLRQWSRRTWRHGQALLTLTEAEHCGVLSVTANHLYRQARGEILVRLDGDTQMLTPHWASRLCAIFDAGPDRLGVVGPLQLNPAGRVHAFGDWVLHPKGYHHVAAGAHPDQITQAVEVDHVMGCFYCCKRAVWDAVGPFDEAMLRGQTIDFGLRSRLAGFACIAVPHVRFVHRHGLRAARATKADSEAGVSQTLDTFRRKWGFCRLAPDLDEVRHRYRGTPLLWNPAVFAPLTAAGAGPADSPVAAEAAADPIAGTPWQRYTDAPSYRQWVDVRTSIIGQVVQQAGRPDHLLIVGGETGLIPHLVAGQGLACTGLERDAAAVELARRCIARSTYPAQPPTIEQHSLERLPVADAATDLAIVPDELDAHPNPVRLLSELRRVVRPAGYAVVILPPPAGIPTPGIGGHGYRPHELIAQVQAVGGFQPASDPSKVNANQPMILVMQRLAEPVAAASAA